MSMPLEHHCFPNVSCTSEDQQRNIYSRIDGLCNNPNQPTQGGAGTDFLHLVAKRKIIIFLSNSGVLPKELDNTRKYPLRGYILILRGQEWAVDRVASLSLKFKFPVTIALKFGFFQFKALKIFQFSGQVNSRQKFCLQLFSSQGLESLEPFNFFQVKALKAQANLEKI